MSNERLAGICPHCGAPDSRRLGVCTVCDRVVCDHCGNVQFVGGERRTTHAECLSKDDDAFKMIKFVR